MAAPPPPGTLIDSQAFVNYLDNADFVSKDLASNRVRVVVTGVSGISLVSSQTRLHTAGSFFTFPHTLTNTGNVTGTFTITPTQRPGSPINLLNLSFVDDANGNGVVDSGEPFLSFAAHTVTLNPGESFHFIVYGQVHPLLPAVMDPVEEVIFDILATNLGTGEMASNIDTLQVPRDAGIGSLHLSKSVNPTVATQGSTADYRIVGTNTSLVTLGPRNIMLNGGSADYFIVRDSIPANLEFVEVLQSNSAIPLYHYAGAAFHAYETVFDPSRTVTAIAWGFDSLPPGGSFELAFRVRVGQQATGIIPNIAEAYYQIGIDRFQTESNISNLTVPALTPTINYYRNTNFDEVIPATRLGNDLYVQVNAGSCNLDPGNIETINVRITSILTGDVETYIAIETGSNTGVFQILPVVPTQDARAHSPVAGDGILQALENDELVAEITSGGCTGVRIWTQILIDPSGIVYDSRTNQPVAGAVVTLYNVGDGTGPATPADVWNLDGVKVSNVWTTGANGAFEFPLVNAGNYRLDIQPPTGYSFASVVPAGLLPAGRRTHNPGSFGGDFRVDSTTGAVFLDIPLDTTSGIGFDLEKEASRDHAEVGDSVVYTLKLTNSSGATFRGAYIDDRLPTGFRYEPGTTSRDGARVGDPEGGVGPSLRFNIGTLLNGETTTFTYRVRLTPGAEKGDGMNVAQATSLGPPVLQSNKAYAQVRPLPGIFDPRGVIIGTVFVDANNNGIQDPGEPGVPGVRLILEDGTYAITDSQGKYSIYGQRALTHALKVDSYSLPPGAILGGDSPRFGMDPGSRFVDMKNFELHKANFMLVEPTDELYAVIEARREQAEKWTPEFSSALEHTFNADGIRYQTTDIEGREASGIIGSGRTLPGPFESVLPGGTLTPENSSLPSSPVAAVPLVDLEKLVETLPPDSFGFIGLKDGDTLPYSQATVRIVGHVEARLELFLNGQPAPEARIGKAVQQAMPPLQATEYVALRFNPGPNLLELVQYDLFGNERGRETITVIAPDKMADLQLTFSTLSPVADGSTPLEIEVQAVDRNGTRVTASMPLTLESSLGRWDVEDVDRVTPGVQVFLEGGRAVYRLLPPMEPGEAKIVISSGALKAEQRIAFLPELRPMIAVGVIEGRFSLNNLSSNNILPVSPDDAFEETLRNISGIGSDGQLSGRAAFYLKGKIKGDTLLTIAYDSNKKRGETELFRDIDPDAFYPIYGDDSIKGYDAQSSGNLYVRIDHGRSYALLGDFNTRANSEVRQLGEYNRSFNGIRLHHETSRLSGDFWITDDSTTQDIQEFPANGTSGPFFFGGGANIVLNSETVEIITRDRNQPAVIINVQMLSRYTDYDFEPFSGRLLLRRPVPSVDEHFNPLFIRVTYELERMTGDRFLTYGGSLQVKLLDRLEVGGSFARDENPFEPYDLQSVNSTLKLAEGTFLIAEGARTDSFLQGEGYAGRLDLRHQTDRTDARIFYGVTDDTFDNPSSQLNAGRIEGGLKATHQIEANTQLIAEGVYTEDKMSTGNRKGLRVDVAHTFENQVKLTVGGRVSEESQTPADPASPNQTPLSVRSLRVRADTPIPKRPDLTVFGEYEQDVLKADQRVIAAGGHYQISTKTRAYARHEFISSLGGPFELDSGYQNNSTIFGLETEYMQNAHFTNEYRVRNAIDGDQAEAATGLRNLWDLSEGLRLNTTFERVTPFRSRTNNQSTAATLGFEYTRPVDWKATGRIEGRWADTSNNYLNTLGYARKINKEWSFLGRSIFNAQLAKGGGGGGAPASDLYQGRLLTGMAWRQAEKDEWNALFRYEYKYEQGTPNLGVGMAGLRRHVHVFGTSVNYQPNRNWIFSGHYATKFVQEAGAGFPSAQYMAHIVAGRAIYEINDKWDAGLNLAATFSNKIDNVQYAVGPEIGRILTKNVRIGIGYNIVGFHDRDFDTAATSHGVFISMRIKFDENLLKWAKFD